MNAQAGPSGLPFVIPSWTRPTQEFGSRTVGAKAFNLLRIPPEWTPDFVILTSRFSERVATEGAHQAYLSAGASDRRAIETLLNTAVTRAEATLPVDPAGIFVRSNELHETGSNLRGEFDSFAVEPDIDLVLEAADAIIGRSPDMCVLVQLAANGSNGQMSNERRVSPRRDQALIEGLPGKGSVTVRATEPNQLALHATSESAVQARLREVLAWSNGATKGLALFEWVWDGSRLWIVQFDQLPPAVADPDFGRLFERSPPTARRRPPSNAPRRIDHFRAVDTTQWKKLRRATKLDQLKIPTADVFIAPGDSWRPIDALNMVEELLSISSDPWVLRTDVGAGIDFPADLLPTSPASRDAKVHEEFLLGARRTFESLGLRNSEWAVLPAPLIRMQISGLSYARPGGTDVAVDALWGYPDGLLHLPHDSFVTGAASLVKANIRYKPACLVAMDGDWRIVRVDAAHDWARTLTDEEILEVGLWCQALANDLDEPVQLMTMHRVEGTKGPGQALAFHYTSGAIRAPSQSEAPHHRKDLVTITSLEDLAAFKDRPGPRGFVVAPRIDLRRDVALLRAVGEMAAKLGAPIVFEGSLLGHAYHILSSSGAAVIPANPSLLAANVRTYDKLVRDKIPAIIERDGSVARVRALNEAEALPLLKRKLLEEAFEVNGTASEGELLEELADVREVLDALEQQVPGGPAAVVAHMTAKRELRGGFRELIFLESTAEGPTPLASEAAGRSQAVRHSEPEMVRVQPGDGIARAEVSFSSLPPLQGGILEAIREIGNERRIVVTVEYRGDRVHLRLRVREIENVEQIRLFDPESMAGPGRYQA